MFLLIRECRAVEIPSLFTFHNVSINSHRQSVKFLHQFVFTFHNVSINSYALTIDYENLKYLHSTMFLLILDTWDNGNIDKVIYIPQCFY